MATGAGRRFPTSTLSTVWEVDLLSPQRDESSGVALSVTKGLDLGVADAKTDKLLAGRAGALENVHNAFEEHTTALASTASEQDRLKALKYVVHFIGDIHQPLHAGYADDTRVLTR